MSLSLMRFMVKADAKLGFVPYDTLLNKKLEVSYRSIEAAFRRCDSLNQVSAGGTARAQQAQTAVDGKAPAIRLLNVYNRIHELYSRICTSVDGLSVFVPTGASTTGSWMNMSSSRPRRSSTDLIRRPTGNMIVSLSRAKASRWFARRVMVMSWR